MALSSILKETCKECGKIAVEKSRIDFGSTKLITLECGHVITEEALSTKINVAKALNNCTLMPYQVKGVEFLMESDARAILADEQGLGKTIMALTLIKLFRKELTPAVIVCPTTVKPQWHYEIREKCGIEGFLTQVIGSSKEMASPGFDIYVTTYDLIKNEKCFEWVKDQIKFVVLDECQRIKNHLSGRAKATQKLCKTVDHILPMSGTPIKNSADEWFTVLNLVRPRMFPHYARFVETECDSYNTGYGYKVGGLRNPELFHDKTREFILRRTKAEVLPDLPELMRKFHHVELDPKLNKPYAEALKELEELMYTDDMDSFTRNSNTLAIMNKMRQITGIGKVTECVDFVTEFLLSTDRKIVVFAHHHAVVNMLEATLNKWLVDGGWSKCLNLNSSLDGESRARLAEKFKEDSNCRVMIASTLAAGEGINLQFCSDAIMLERQWNPAGEEQAEGRFHRFGQRNPVSVSYMIASETIDEYFTELVEQKRAIVASSVDGQEIRWDQESLMSELANILVTKGKKSWKL